MIKFDRKRINWDTVIFGSAFFLLQVPFLPSTIEFRLFSIVTVGEVVKLNAGGFHPEIEFTTRDGERVSFAGSTTTRAEVGDRIEVRYRLDTPRLAEVNNLFSIWGFNIFLTVFSAIFVVGGLFGMQLRENWRGGSDD